MATTKISQLTDNLASETSKTAAKGKGTKALRAVSDFMNEVDNQLAAMKKAKTKAGSWMPTKRWTSF